MPVELKEKYPFSVDTWTTLSKRKRHHFLTHAHSDHTSGIESFSGRSIYCSDTTRKLILRRFAKLKSSQFVILEVGEAKLIPDHEQPFTVTAFDANHCPGAVMLTFEGNFGSVLHTGDCRLSQNCLSNLLSKHIGQQRFLDCVFLDCTFGKERLKMPTKQEAISQVRECILKEPQAPVVYLACDGLGHEELLSELTSVFRTKIYVDKDALPEYFADMMITAPDLVTQDSQSTRFHICEGFPKLYEKAKKAFLKAHKMKQPYPIFIRPSAQWYTYDERLEGAGSGMILSTPLKRPGSQRRSLPAPKGAQKDGSGVWHVCYSLHSCRSELEAAVEALWPKEVISTTPNCPSSEIISQITRLNRLDFGAGVTCREEAGTEWRATEGAKRVFRVNRNITVMSSPGHHRASKKACVDENSGMDGLADAVVPLFGAAQYVLPPSPPMSFASTASFSNEDSDSQSSVERFLGTCEASLETAGEASSNVSNFTASSDATEPCEDGVCVNFLSATDRGNKTNWADSKSSAKSESFKRAAGQLTLEEANKESVSVWGSKNIAQVCTKVTTNVQGVSVLENTTKILYRSLQAPIPSPLPSLLELYDDSSRYLLVL